MQVESSAPTRLDLAGGTLDIWPLYLFHDDAQTINAAITIRASCTITASNDGAWHISSEDLGTTISLPSLSAAAPDAYRLTHCLLRFFSPKPIRVVTRSDSPVGAGLAGSSAMNIALCGALSRYTGARYAPENLITLAMNLEAKVIGVPTGAQDYRPAMYGGISTITMGPSGIKRKALKVDPKRFGDRIVLAYTGQSRDSGINNWDITKRYIDGDINLRSLFGQLAKVASKLRQAIEMEDWISVGKHLRHEWDLRKRLAPSVTTTSIDELVSQGLKAGAQAAKVCGAGGGGCILFLTDPTQVAAVQRTLKNAGASILDADIDERGLVVDVS